MAEIKNNSGIGQIQIADDVIATIAGTSALEIDGVSGMSGNLTGDIIEIIGGKNLSKGVKIEVTEGSVVITVNILVKFGYKIPEISLNVQKRIKTAVETMTGLQVTEVNVFVSGAVVEKEKGKENLGKSMDNE